LTEKKTWDINFSFRIWNNVENLWSKLSVFSLLKLVIKTLLYLPLVTSFFHAFLSLKSNNGKKIMFLQIFSLHVWLYLPFFSTKFLHLSKRFFLYYECLVPIKLTTKVVFGLTNFRLFYSLKEEVRPNNFLKKYLI